ncbi:hypothetical protein SSX86_004932 [Deinandra increscens subsp. villosa]|uniref:Uncharacterized protein n=1 Tax=Deinandra increscens subsp. villosa TaxID=3103831 RepID=A0AAP0DT01_9ASTR
MDFSKTKLYQRTRSGYQKLYSEFNEKKHCGRRRNGAAGAGAGDGGGLVSDSGGARATARAGGDISKDKGFTKSKEVLRGIDGGRNESDAVARRTRQSLRGKGKKNLGEVHLIDESENDDESDDHLQNRISSGIEDASVSEKIEKIIPKGQSQNKGKHVNQNSLVDEDSQRNSGDADDALSYLGDSCKLSRSVGDEFDKNTKDSSLSLGGFSVGETDENDDGEDVMYLGDDVTCLDDYDPSLSSHVESNEVKVSPVEQDSVQADVDEAKLQGQKSSEEEDDDPQKLVSPEEDGRDWEGIKPVENNPAAGDKEVISLSSSSDSEDGEKDGNAMDDDGSSVLEVEDIDNLDDVFWTKLEKHTSDRGNDHRKPHLCKPKPVCEPVRKIEEVDFLEPVVSKKRCSSSNDSLKPIEGGLKKKCKTGADSSLGSGRNNKNGGEDDFWQIIDEKDTQKDWKSTSKKCDRFGKKINVIEVLTNALREEGDEDTLFKRYVDIPTEENPIEKTHVDEIQLYKFKFEDEEDIKPPKLESEMEVDGLFDEMNMCLQVLEIGSSDTSGVKCLDANFSVEGTNQATCCRRGKHQLTINDEFGIICRYCSYVEMEIRDILPPLVSPIFIYTFSKNGRGGHGRHDHDKTDNMKFSDLKLTESHQECHHDSKGSEYEKATVWDLVPGVKESMYPHQREGFEFIWNKIAGGTNIDKLEKRLPSGGSGCIISHAPGTGKTRLTIVFLQAFLKMYPTSRPLIIAPRSMLLTWEEEFKKWKVDFPFFNLNTTEFSGQERKIALTLIKKYGNSKNQRQLRFLKLYSWKKTPSVLGITYRLFESLAGEEGKRKQRANNNAEDDQMKKILLQVPTLLVLDEGHTPRNDQSLMWKTLLNVKTKRSIILSGTPFQNNFDELYNTFCLVNPLLCFGISSFNSMEFSKKRGWKHSSTKDQWDSLTSSVRKGQRNLQELRDLIDPFVHVHKGTILQERLPGLRDALVVLRPTKTQQTLLAKMSGLKLSLGNDHLMSLVSVHPSLLPKSAGKEGFHKMLKVFENDPTAGVKTNFLMELIKLSGAHNEKVLVFCQYIKPLEFIMQLMKTNFRWIEGREFLYMDGQKEEKHRQASINTLNDPQSEVKVLIASLRACSEGINLVGASRVVLLDVHWNPSVERQAISRAYRLGQKKLVHVYHLVTGSMEGEKYIRQVEKSHLSELVFSSKNKDSSNPQISSTVSKDKILEEMVQHDKLRNMFEKVIYQPKEADLIDTFG